MSIGRIRDGLIFNNDSVYNIVASVPIKPWKEELRITPCEIFPSVIHQDIIIIQHSTIYAQNNLTIYYLSHFY